MDGMSPRGCLGESVVMRGRQQSEAASRFEERRKREDQAPRLHDEVPRLQSLRIQLDEYRQDGGSPLVSHTRHIVVERAPALFRFPCGERDCVDGGYDVTRAMLRVLATGSELIQGEQHCDGLRNGTTCRHKLRYTAHASYAP
jgi:hypothetical protein